MRLLPNKWSQAVKLIFVFACFSGVITNAHAGGILGDARHVFNDSNILSSEKVSAIGTSSSSLSFLSPSLTLQRQDGRVRQAKQAKYEKQKEQISPAIFKLSRNYEFVFFYSAQCHHCMSFDFILKQYSDDSGIGVRAFAVGNGISPSFPKSVVVVPEVIERFFGSGASIAVPALFILNKDNYHAYPVSRGAHTYLELTMRMNELAPKILTYERGRTMKAIR